MRDLKHGIRLPLDRGAIAHENDIEYIDDEECKQTIQYRLMTIYFNNRYSSLTFQ